MTTKHGSHWLEREDFGDVTVARVKAVQILDDTTIRDVFDPIYSLVNIGRARLVLDLSVVEYVPSLALGKLVMLNRKTQAAGGRLTLCGLTKTVDEVLRVTHLKPLFAVYESEKEAVRSFAQTSPGASSGDP